MILAPGNLLSQAFQGWDSQNKLTKMFPPQQTHSLYTCTYLFINLDLRGYSAKDKGEYKGSYIKY